jgi:hypothetical protein
VGCQHVIVQLRQAAQEGRLLACISCCSLGWGTCLQQRPMRKDQ